MKRVLSVSLIIGFLLSFCILEEVLVKKTLTTMYDKAILLYNEANQTDNVNTKKIKDLSKELDDYWQKHENLLCFFVNHKDMHEMGNELNRVNSYAEDNIKEEFIASLNLVIYYSETFHHIMGVSFQNII